MAVDMTTQSIAVGDNWVKVGNDYVGDQPSGSISLPSANLVVDGFESYSTGNLSDPTLNNATFSWEAPNRTSIVTGGVGANQTLYPNAVVVNDTRDWSAKEGNNSLRFRYPANTEMAEQRFNFDAQSELWIRYWIRVPTNYTHGSANNKFLSIWQNAYDNLGTITVQTMPNGSGGALLEVQDGGVLGGQTLSTQFISSPTDRGRWMQIVFQLKAATTNSSNDGEYRCYRRWDGETTFTLLQEYTGMIRQYSDGSGYRNGYLMGWANDPYTADTEWLIDDFEMSTGSLI